MESSVILVILVAIILLVITIYCALMSHKLKFFNDKKFRIIFKDSLALIIIPLLVNIFSNKLKLKAYVTCVILLILLFIAYLLADTWNQPKTNDKHIIPSYGYDNFAFIINLNKLYYFKIPRNKI